MIGECPKCGEHVLECICTNLHDELREKLRHLNDMERDEVAMLVTKILEYLMDNAKFRDEE